MTVEDKIDDKELKDINPQRDDYEDEINTDYKKRRTCV